MIVKKEFKFESAHRLMSSYTKACQRVHGHSYRVNVELDYPGLNEDGMVIDFKKLKDKVQPLFDLLDHALIFCEKDTKYVDFFTATGTVAHINGPWPENLDADVILMEENPTAENMAIKFHEVIGYLLAHSLPEFFHALLTISVFETVTSEAVYSDRIQREIK